MILGISPGTRTCGFAVVRDGEVKKWSVKSYKEKWSDGKLIGILYSISQLINRHKIQDIALKMPDAVPRSLGYAQLIGALNALFETRGINARYYALSDIAGVHAPGEKINRKTLFGRIADRHTELQQLYRKEAKSSKPYYDKVFEAVGATHCLRHRK